METIQAASYARVASEQQAEAKTIASQIAALRARVAPDGLALPDERQFVDEDYSSATLIRPALEQLGDPIAAGGVDRLYVHSPDRLARKYAYQVLLIDEFHRAGVEVIVLTHELGRSPEDDLLLQVQGMVAEYERAKSLERSRRGTWHAAQSGEVSVLTTAPYGYLCIGKHDAGGEGRFEMRLEEARVVRQVFAWIGRDRPTIGEVVRRLNAAGERTRTGKTTGDRTTIWGMLKNPAYRGQAACGKTRVGPLHPRLRTQRGRSLHPRRAYSTTDVPPDAWLFIPVPAPVSAELFAAVQTQLEANRRRARQGERGARYVLQGLVPCQQCGYACYGKAISPSARKGNPRDYACYRCIETDAYRFGGERLCSTTQVRTDLLDLTVWQELWSLLEDPQRVEQEYRRRLAPPPGDQRSQVDAQPSKLRQDLALHAREPGGGS